MPAVVRRSRADWPVVGAAWVLLACALSLVAAGTLYANAVTIAGLHRELRAATAVDRSLLVRTRLPADRMSAADDAVTPELERILGPTGGEVALVLRSSPYARTGTSTAAATDLTEFDAFDGIERHATLVEGTWATPGKQPVEATLSEGAAAALGLAVGDTVQVTSRIDRSRTLDARITGIWRPDPADPYWFDDPLALTGASSGGSFRTEGPLVVAPGDLVGGPLAEPLDVQWRAIPSVDGFTPDNLGTVTSLFQEAAERVNAALPPSSRGQVLTKLPDILASVDRSVLVTQSGILLLLIQFGVLAAYAVFLVAALLLDRRRTETALLRARGAGFAHLLAMASAEALLITVPAMVVAPWLATLLVLGVRLNPALAGLGLDVPLPGPSTFGATLVAGACAILALTIPTVATSVSIAGVRVAVGRQVGRTLPQRLGLDLVLVVLAAIALVQLRLYGAPLTRNARGVLGVDPLLVAAPAIGLVAGAVLAIRIVPRLAELAERVLAGGRRLVPALAGRQLARRPLRYTRAALLLILAAALGTFASAHSATWARSQGDQAAFAAGADVRLSPGTLGSVPAWGLGGVLRGLPGVVRATPIVDAAIQLGTTLRDGELLGVDGAGLADVIRVREDASGDATRRAIAALGAAREAAPGQALPAGTKRVALTLDSTIEPVEGFGTVPSGYEGIEAALDLIDADGRLVRVPAPAGPLGVQGARIVVPLTAPDGSEIAAPATLAALRLAVSIARVTDGAAHGSVDLVGVETSPDAEGDTWTPLPITGGRSAITLDNNRTDSDSPGPLPERLTFDTLFPSQRLEYARSLIPAVAPVAPIVVGQAFLDRTGAAVGDTLGATVFGVPLKVRILGSIDGFPTIDPAKPFALIDGLSLDLARAAARVAPADTSAWWLATKPGTSAAVAAAVAADPIAAIDVVDRTAVEGGLTGDPLALGVIGILGLGSIAALVFAAIGFLVSVSVSTTERLGELALLKALGLAPRQLLGWLSLESIALLATGLLLGVGLGLVLAWLSLPFATLTAAGETPVPAPEVVVPVEALVPTIALGLLLVLGTILLIRQQLPGARTSAVLRARDE